VLLVGTEGARLCQQCKAIEVLMYRRWVTLDDYVERRRAARAGAVLR
jgi:hypothetical protein